MTSTRPILDEMMNCAQDARNAGLRVTCFVFGTAGAITLYKEITQGMTEPNLPPFTIEEGEPSKLCDYGGFPCWYLPPPLVDEVYENGNVSFDITPAVLPDEDSLTNLQ